MGFKVVTKKQNGQDVVMGFVPEDAHTVEGADLHPKIFESQAKPKPSEAVKRFVDLNPNRSFDLHKLVDGEIVCRSIQELQDSEWIDWEHNWARLDPEEGEE